MPEQTRPEVKLVSSSTSNAAIASPRKHVSEAHSEAHPATPASAAAPLPPLLPLACN